MSRMCGGSRSAGGVYLIVKKGPGGAPLEDFLMDPPVPFDPAALGLSSVGVGTIERGGAVHIADRIGLSFYPNVFDFIQEAKIDPVGISRRIPRSFDFRLITDRSRLLLAHDRAMITEPTAYHDDRVDFLPGIAPYCPKGIPAHTMARPRGAFPPYCLGLSREDTSGADLVLDPAVPARVALRELKTPDGLVFGSYDCAVPPTGVPRNRYQPAFFMSLPIHAIQVVGSPDGEHVAALAAARRSQIDVELVSE